MSEKTDSKKAKAGPQGEHAPAAKAAARAQRVPHADKTQYRRDAILAELSTRTAKTTGTLWMGLKDTFGYRRKLERDLEDLNNAGLIRRVADGWLDNREKDVLAESATYAALRLLMDLVDDIVPGELQKSIAKQLSKAKARLAALPTNDPAARWLRAFRIVPPRHPLGDPIIDPDVRDTVEVAILMHRKARLRWQDVRWESRDGESETERIEYVAEHSCSISHFLIEVPANPAIEIWYEGRSPKRLELKEVISAELLDESADYPASHEPELTPGLMKFVSEDSRRQDGKCLLTLAMAKDTYVALQGNRIGKHLTVIEEDCGGQMIVGMLYHLDLPTLKYFEQLPGVTVLGPTNFRRFAGLPARRKYAEYRKTEAIAGGLSSWDRDEIAKQFTREIAEKFREATAAKKAD
jgi:hypothetical protein